MYIQKPGKRGEPPEIRRRVVQGFPILNKKGKNNAGMPCKLDLDHDFHCCMSTVRVAGISP